MIMNHAGELAALLTAVFWTITALAIESASKKVGSLSVNLIRLVVSFIFLSLFSLITRGLLFPIDANGFTWFWLSISGLIGFVLGDLFLFKSYTLIGARVAMLVMSLAPPIAAFAGWLLLDETLSLQHLLGMVLTLSGIAVVILEREKPDTQLPSKKFKISYSIVGLLCAFGGAAGQGIGLVVSKYGMGNYDPFAATQIRVITGIFGFSLLIALLRRWGRVAGAVKNKKAMWHLSIGAFFGPFLGVSFSLLAVKYTSTGVASTIMSLVPVLIIAPSALILKEKVHLKEIMGAILAFVGVALFFL